MGGGQLLQWVCIKQSWQVAVVKYGQQFKVQLLRFISIFYCRSEKQHKRLTKMTNFPNPYLISCWKASPPPSCNQEIVNSNRTFQMWTSTQRESSPRCPVNVLTPKLHFHIQALNAGVSLILAVNVYILMTAEVRSHGEPQCGGGKLLLCRFSIKHSG